MLWRFRRWRRRRPRTICLLVILPSLPACPANGKSCWKAVWPRSRVCCNCNRMGQNLREPSRIRTASHQCRELSSKLKSLLTYSFRASTLSPFALLELQTTLRMASNSRAHLRPSFPTAAKFSSAMLEKSCIQSIPGRQSAFRTSPPNLGKLALTRALRPEIDGNSAYFKAKGDDQQA